MDAGLFLIKSRLDDVTSPGYYTAAGILAKIAFSLLSALPLTLLPSVSKAVAENNLSLVKKYVSASLRYSLMLLVPLSVLIYGYAEQVLTLFYPNEFAVAGNALRLLIIGYGFFALFFLLSSVLSGAGHHVFAMMVAFGLIVDSVYIWINTHSALRPGGAAIAALFAGLIGFIACLIRTVSILDVSGKFFPWRSFIHIILAAIPLFTLIRLLPVEGMGFLIYSVLLSILYLLLLWLMQEFNVEDRKLFYFWRRG